MIRFSAVLVAVAIGVLIGGVATSKLLLVYVAIGVSAAALVALAIGVALKREELFGEGQATAPAEAGSGQPVLTGQNSAAMLTNGRVASPQSPPFGMTGQRPFGDAASANGGPGGWGDASRAETGRGDAPGGRVAFGQPPVAAAAGTARPPAPDAPPAPAAKSGAPWETEPREAPSPWGAPREAILREAQAPWDKPREPQPGWGTAAQPPRDPQPPRNTPVPWNADQREARPPLPGRHSRNADAPLSGFAAPPPPTAPASTPGFTRPGSGSGSTAQPPSFPWDDRPKPSFQPATPAASPTPGSGAVAGAGGPGRSWFDRSAAAPDAKDAGATGPGARDIGDEAPTTGGDKADEQTAAEASAATPTTGVNDDTTDTGGDWRSRYSWLLDSDDDDATPAAADSAEPTAEAEPSATAAVDEPGPNAEIDEPAPKPEDATVIETAAPEPSAEDEPAATVDPEASATEAVTARDASDDADAAGGDEAKDAAQTPSGERLVTVVPGVPRFHDASCILIRFMAESDVQKMTIPEAEEAGCTPCAACNPE